MLTQASNSTNYQGIFRFDPVCGSRLLDPSVKNDLKLVIISELRDSIEVVHSNEYPIFLSNLLPSFFHLLRAIQPQDFGENVEHKLRNAVLEIIHRFPFNESLKPFAQDLISLLMDVLISDNEDNAVIALKIIVDLHKNYSPLMKDYVQRFLEIVKDIYLNMPMAVKQVFVEEAQMETKPKSKAAPKPIPKSVYSFKVLTECPIIVALLFQLHRDFVSNSVPMFVEPIINVTQK